MDTNSQFGNIFKTHSQKIVFETSFHNNSLMLFGIKVYLGIYNISNSFSIFLNFFKK